MKIVALIPFWFDYKKDESNNHNNLKKLANKHLINYSIEALNSVSKIDETIIYCSDEKINSYINPDLDYTFLKRNKDLDSNKISIDKIISTFLSEVDSDIIVLLHPNSPFLSSFTINECLKSILINKYESSFAAYKVKKFAWFNNKPLNYEFFNETPSFKNINPVVIEQSSLYVFTRESFLENNKRLSNSPYIQYINHFEGLDISNDEDFEIAELIVNSGMYPRVVSENI